MLHAILIKVYIDRNDQQSAHHWQALESNSINLLRHQNDGSVGVQESQMLVQIAPNGILADELPVHNGYGINDMGKGLNR